MDYFHDLFPESIVSFLSFQHLCNKRQGIIIPDGDHQNDLKRDTVKRVCNHFQNTRKKITMPDLQNKLTQDTVKKFISCHSENMRII